MNTDPEGIVRVTVTRGAHTINQVPFPPEAAGSILSILAGAHGPGLLFKHNRITCILGNEQLGAGQYMYKLTVTDAGAAGTSSAMTAGHATAATLDNFKARLDMMEQTVSSRRYLANWRMYTVTTYAHAAEMVLNRSTCATSAAHVLRRDLMRQPVPDCMTRDKISRWENASQESQLQGLATPAFEKLARTLQHAGPRLYTVIDTHASGYTLPPAKPDLVLSRFPQKTWLQVVAAVELKVDFNGSAYKDAVGEMYDRCEKVIGIQQSRDNMLCLALSKDQIAVWRMYPKRGRYEQYGPVAFKWEEDNEGYQILVTFLKPELGTFGYHEFRSPADCILGDLQLTSWRALAGAGTKRWVFVANLTGDGAPVGGKDVVVKTGTKASIEYEIHMFSKHENEAILPKLLYPRGQDRSALQLPTAIDTCTHFLVLELGEHISEDSVDDPVGLYNVMTQLAEGLSRLASQGTIHRDVSPDNIVMIEGKPKLLDLGVAWRHSKAGEAEELRLQVTGKPLYLSLRLLQPHACRQSINTDMESLFYCFLYYASRGHALKPWLAADTDLELQKAKHTSIYMDMGWLELMDSCKPVYRETLQRLRDIVFLATITEAKKTAVDVQAFVQALRDAASQAQGLQ